MTTITSDRRSGLDRRIAVSGETFPQRIGYLGQMLGLQLDAARLDEPLSQAELSAVRPSPRDPRSARALGIAREGWSLRDILAHGVIDYHPVIAGPAVEAADHMQVWFEAGAADGFWLSPDVYEAASMRSSMAWSLSCRIAGCFIESMAAKRCVTTSSYRPNTALTLASRHSRDTTRPSPVKIF